MARFTFPGKLLFAALFLATLLIPTRQAQGLFIKPDLAQIPVQRLVMNMEQMVRAKPKDVKLRYNLARVHAMAYAQKTNTVQVQRNKQKNGAWFGYTPKYVPFKVVKTMDKDKLKAAQEHLDKALSHYRAVMKLDPKHLGAALGHAWLLDQSGKKMKAMQQYRQIVDAAWATEGKKQVGPLGGNFVTIEAANYLIPLLDKEKNNEEIERLQQKMAKLKKLPRPITPIAIPLTDGLRPNDFIDPTARVSFDADGSGIRKEWTWIRPEAGWLVFDPHGKKKITSALQMFGNVTFWLFWDNGYQALATLDDDHDGYLSGSELEHLAIWRDANSNGVSESGELKSLSQYGIAKLSCDYVAGSSPYCAAASPFGVFFTDGTRRSSYDVILQQR